MKKFFLLLIIFNSLSARSQTGIKNEKEEIVLTDLTYITPVFIHENKNEPIVYNRYEEISQITLDSLFIANSKKYKIIEKIDYEYLNNSNLIKDEIKQLFKSVNNDKNEFNLDSTETLKSLINKSNNKFVVLISINTRDRKPSQTGPILYKTHVEFIIIDRINQSLVFFDKSKNLITRNGGYQITLSKNLKDIYKKLEKWED